MHFHGDAQAIVCQQGVPHRLWSNDSASSVQEALKNALGDAQQAAESLYGGVRSLSQGQRLASAVSFAEAQVTGCLNKTFQKNMPTSFRERGHFFVNS